VVKPSAGAPGHPIGGQDYPRTLAEFDEWFSSEAACVAYLSRLRWLDGFTCPACGGGSAWSTGRGLLRCKACQRQTSALAGTVLEGTRKPLRTWFQAMWYVTSQKSGVSALGLQRVLGFGSYQTAWTWLHKLRRAMVRPGRDRLHGVVEVDETYVGGVDAGAKGRANEDKSIVMVAVEVLSPSGFGRVRLRQVPDASKESLIGFIANVVEQGSTIRTDGLLAYRVLPSHGYDHQKNVIQGSGTPAHVSMPAVHRIASLLKRWLLGTHQGSVSGKHLDYYLDEFAFRFNRRSSRARGLLFYRLLQQAVEVSPTSYRGIVATGTSEDHNR
jgi:transposase-like protein